MSIKVKRDLQRALEHPEIVKSVDVQILPEAGPSVVGPVRRGVIRQRTGAQSVLTEFWLKHIGRPVVFTHRRNSGSWGTPAIIRIHTGHCNDKYDVPDEIALGWQTQVSMLGENPNWRTYVRPLGSSVGKWETRQPELKHTHGFCLLQIQHALDQRTLYKMVKQYFDAIGYNPKTNPIPDGTFNINVT